MLKGKPGEIEPFKIWNAFRDVWDTIPSKSEGKELKKFHSNEKDYIVELVESEGKKGDKVIDLGCGKGKLLLELTKGKFELYGVDISPKMLREASSNLENGKFEKGDITEGNPFSEDNFDFVLCTGNTLGNIKERDKVAELSYDVLDGSGVAIFGVYNANYLTFDFVSNYYAKLHSYYGPSFPFHLESFDKKNNLVVYREGLFSHWFEEREIKKLMRKAGFEHVRVVEEAYGYIVVCRK